MVGGDLHFPQLLEEMKKVLRQSKMQGLINRRGIASPPLAAVIICTVQLVSSPYLCTSFVIPPSPNQVPLQHNTLHGGKDISESLEWDGVPIEGAHDEEFDDGEDDAFVPSISFMSLANSIPSAAFDDFKFTVSKGKLHQESLDEDLNEDYLLDMGGDPSFLDEVWDGIVIEGAHEDEFEPGSGKIDASDIFVPSANFMSMAGSIASPIIDAAVNDFDPLSNRGRLHKAELKEDVNEDDLLEIGGDPFFLEDGDREESDQRMLKAELDEPNDFEWDGFVDEDAHLDFD